MVPLDWLEQIETISTLRVLTTFCKKAKSEGSMVFDYRLTDIYSDSGLAKNSAVDGLKELCEKGIITIVERGSGRRPNRFSINLAVSEVEPQDVAVSKDEVSKVETTTVLGEWKKSVAVRGQGRSEKESEIANSIKDLDLFSINLYTIDINSMSVDNPNATLSKKDIGYLAQRIVLEIFKPRLSMTVNAKWFGYQIGITKRLLAQYRTEQIIAAIVYWTEISDQKITSLRYLTYANKKGTSKLMVALDYFKAEYLKQGGDNNVEEVIERIVTEESEKQKRLEEEKARVSSMSDDDFLDSLLGNIGGK